MQQSQSPQGEVGRAPKTQPAPTSAATWAATLALSVAEAADGSRPVTQLHRWVSEKVYQEIRASAQAAQASRRIEHSAARRFRLRRIMVTHPSRDVTTASAVIDDGVRAKGAHLHLELHRDRWILTELVIL
jgi:hypothetical protein